MSKAEQFFCRSAPWRALTRHALLPWALKGLQPTGRLLELGGGSGAMAEETAATFPGVRVVATDIDPAMVAVMRRTIRHPAVEVAAADATRLPFDDQSFRVVTMNLMLHHVIDYRAALEEAQRVLEPGGALIGYDLTRTALARAVHVLDRSPHRLLAAHDFAPVLAAAGFSDVRVETSWLNHLVRFRARKASPAS